MLLRWATWNCHFCRSEMVEYWIFHVIQSNIIVFCSGGNKSGVLLFSSTFETIEIPSMYLRRAIILKKGMELYHVNEGIFNLKDAKTLNNHNNCPQILKVFSFRNGNILTWCWNIKRETKISTQSIERQRGIICSTVRNTFVTFRVSQCSMGFLELCPGTLVVVLYSNLC